MLDDPRKGTAVASLSSGSIVALLTYALFLLHLDVPAPVVAIVAGILGAAAGMIVHSTTLKEDRAALHQFILARLGNHPSVVPPVAPSAPPPRSQGQQ